jgi:sterol desaturase/sphingolipid hydroxylase (fatty acid hydroxylase superfamily)
MPALAWVLVGLLLGVLVGTFGEYWIHRAMHRGLFLAKRHWEHHRQDQGQGALKEFRDYAFGTVALGVLSFPPDYYCVSGGTLAVGILCGTLAHAMFAAWCHQAQHQDPRLVPWLSSTPVHFVHHKRGQSRHNFGISVDWWDRVFRTYKPEPDWLTVLDPGVPPGKWWQIDWLGRREKLDTAMSFAQTNQTSGSDTAFPK